jgi:hypothetical protein
MGGSRSGRWGSSKPFAEALRRLDVADYPTEMNVEAARHGRVLEMKLPTRRGFDRSYSVHDHTLALWRLSGVDGLPTLQRAGPSDIRRPRQNRLQALSSCSISVAMWGCERSCALGNRQDRTAPNHAAGPLLQARGNALAHVQSPL